MNTTPIGPEGGGEGFHCPVELDPDAVGNLEELINRCAGKRMMSGATIARLLDVDERLDEFSPLPSGAVERLRQVHKLDIAPDGPTTMALRTLDDFAWDDDDRTFVAFRMNTRGAQMQVMPAQKLPGQQKLIINPEGHVGLTVRPSYLGVYSLAEFEFHAITDRPGSGGRGRQIMTSIELSKRLALADPARFSTAWDGQYEVLERYFNIKPRNLIRGHLDGIKPVYLTKPWTREP